MKAGINFLRSCTYQVGAGDYQPLFGEIEEWDFLLKSEKEQQCQKRLFQLDRTVLGFTHSFIYGVVFSFH